MNVVRSKIKCELFSHHTCANLIFRLKKFGLLLIVNTGTVIVIYNTPQNKKDNISYFFTPSVSMGETVDWTYAICELLDKQGVDLRK